MYNQRQAKGVSSAEHILQRGTASGNGVFPCLFPRSGKARDEENRRLEEQEAKELEAKQKEMKQQLTTEKAKKKREQKNK